MRCDTRFALAAVIFPLLSISIAAGHIAARQESAAPPHSAITPVPRDGGAYERHELLNQRVAAQPDAKVIFIGDSITHGWEGARQVWEQYYGERKAINLGIGGDRTQHVLWRLANGNLEGLDPELAVVMIGTNNSNGEDNTVSEIADGVRAIVAMLREALPDTKILLLEIFPRGAQPNEQRGKVLQVNQILRKIHDGEHVYVLDIGHHFLAEDGTIPAAIMPDALHLSEDGYRLWGEALKPTVALLLGEED